MLHGTSTPLKFNRPKPEALPCGDLAVFDSESSTYASRCTTCFAVVGSVGMNKYCRELLEEQQSNA